MRSFLPPPVYLWPKKKSAGITLTSTTMLQKSIFINKTFKNLFRMSLTSQQHKEILTWIDILFSCDSDKNKMLKNLNKFQMQKTILVLISSSLFPCQFNDMFYIFSVFPCSTLFVLFLRIT